MNLPSRFEDIEQLEDFMSAPSQALVNALACVSGDIMVLGVGGKMGPTLARMAKRAAPAKRIIGVARFSEAGLRERLQQQGVECLQADLLSREALTALPEADNIIFMAGRKFGSRGSEWLTWAMNAHVPALVAERYRSSRIVAFSTACVYPFVSVAGNGAKEELPSTAPSGEYANSCVAREPIDLTMGYANIIWQGEANDWALQSLAHCETPTSALNLSGPRISIRATAQALGERLGIAPVLSGAEADTAWLVDCDQANTLFGAPKVSLETMLDWTADWAQRGMSTLGKPTHYETRDGKY